MRKLLTFMALMVLTASIARGQELEIKDKVNLGEKASAGASFTPDGKKILLANTENNSDSIAYTAIGIDGKNKKEPYKFKLGQLKQWRPQDVYNVFNNRRGICSADGSTFLTCPDLDKQENLQILHLGIPVVTCGMDGKTASVYRPNQSQQNVGNFAFGMLLINSVFGKDDAIYYVAADRVIQNERGLSGTSKIMKFDPKTRQIKTLANMDAVVLPIIFISPDQSRLAGLTIQMDIVNYNGIQSMRFWAYDIPTGKISYSMQVGDNIYNTMPNIVWSQDNSTIYAAMTMMGMANGLKIFKPFVEPQKPDEEEAKTFKALAVQLGDEDYKQRDAASAKLQAAGAKASGILEEATQSADPEIATRAKKIISELTGKITTILDRRNIESFCEAAPGYLCVKSFNSNTVSIVDVATRKSKTFLPSDKLMLIDKAGELGLFRDMKDQSLWTAKIVFTAESQPATAPDSKPETAGQ